jgi:putative colanic acid biosynthesis acetyltransferase WcaF
MIFQDLDSFKLPKNFRGKNPFFVQLWWIVQAIFFKNSPQVFYGWRRFLLRLFGAKIGKKVIIRPTVRTTYPWKLTIGDYSWIGDDVVLYTLGSIDIGKNVVVSQKSYICTGAHDYSQEDFPIYQKPIHISDQAWIATDVFVAPGVTIGKGTVVGARSSVFKSLPENGVYMGSPAKFVRKRKLDDIKDSN